ncbi:MAG: P-II family nitrogen regulator [Chitinispirillia bacterium]|jgi:hypothetical protein
MKLVVIFLNRIEFLEDLLSAFLEIGVSGATVIDSMGMGRIVSHNIPIFAGLQESFAGSSPRNKMIFSVVKSEMVPIIADVVQDICGRFDEPDSGIIISLPVESVYGLKQ